ncbi:MAG: TadE/TadG family type IV pilus assembly protein [Pseudomonadota bacterium]
MKRTEKMRKRGILMLLRRFGAQTKGAIAIEFAIILPIMITMYFGVVEIGHALAANRKVTMTTSTVGDLVAQFSTIGPNAMNGLVTAASEIMRPFDTSGSGQLKINVYSISNTPTNDWTYTQGGACAGGTPTVPAALLASGGSVIVSRVCYDFDSILHRFFTANETFEDTFYLRPRQGNFITWDASE